MLETTLSGLLIAGVSGLTVLAYKRPRGYAKMHVFLRWIPWVVLFCGYAWNMDITFARYRMLPFIAPDKSDASIAYVEMHTISFLWLMVGGLGSSLYLSFLRNLPDILKEEQNDTTTKSGSPH